MAQTITAAGTQSIERVRRRAKAKTRAMQRLLADLVELPPYAEAPDLYTDWGEDRSFQVEVGQGECAQ